MNCRGVVFDLDGTLFDTLADIAAAANRVLAARGYPIHPLEAYRWFVGDGSAVLMARALPEGERTKETIQSCLDAFLEDYNHHWAQETRTYDGIAELLDWLVRRAIQLAVVTNKPHQFTRLMVDHYLPGIPFCFLSGLREGVLKKPDPGQALAAATAMGVPPGQCIFLGDSAVDMQTAVRAGMTPIGAGWGFRPAEELIQAGACQVISHPTKMTALISPS